MHLEMCNASQGTKRLHNSVGRKYSLTTELKIYLNCQRTQLLTNIIHNRYPLDTYRLKRAMDFFFSPIIVGSVVTVGPGTYQKMTT